MKNNKRVKLVAISVAMMLGAQCAMADSTAINVSDSETLKSVLKQSTVIDYVQLTENSIKSKESIKLGAWISGGRYAKSITIDGGNSTLDSNGLSLGINPREALFDVQPGTELNIRNTLIKDVNSVKWGGAIYNEGTLKAENMSFYNNSSTLSGAIANMSHATLNGNMKFTSNRSSNDGGAIFNIGTLDISSGGGHSIDFSSNSAGKFGGAIYNGKGSITHSDDSRFKDSIGRITFNSNSTYNFENNSAISGGAIYNASIMTITGKVYFKGNKSSDNGGAIYNDSGNLNLIGSRGADGISSIVFDGNTAGLNADGTGKTHAQYKGGALYVVGEDSSPAYVNIISTDFKNNKVNTHGGAVYFDKRVDFIIEGSHFSDNRVVGKPGETGGWGGAIGLGNQGYIAGFINNSVFERNYSTDSGGVMASNTGVTIVNSQFYNNTAKYSAGAISWNPKGRYNSGEYLKLIADGGDTIFGGNYVEGGEATSQRTNSNGVNQTSSYVISNSQEGIYIGNYSSNSRGDDGNDSTVYFNAGNSGSLIFNDIVNAYGDSFDDVYRDRLNPRNANNNIQLNASGVKYGRLESTSSFSNTSFAPTNGMIIFNNTVKGANLVLHEGTLAFRKENSLNGYVSSLDKYFSVGAKITLKGGTLDLSNGILEGLDGKNNFNPDSINVIGNDVKLRLDVSLDKGTIDYIDSEITGNGKITIDKLLFNTDMSSDSELGDSFTLQFVKKNSLADSNTELVQSLQTVITSKAGYSLGLTDKNSKNDSIKVTKVVNSGGLPVAVSIGQDEALAGAKTYIYNATTDEYIGSGNSWHKGYFVKTNDMDTPQERYTSNVLKGEYLEINGNGKNVIATNDKVIGIVLDADTYYPESISINNQTLTINDVKGVNENGDVIGWKGFNTAIINKGGTVNLSNSIFSNNKSQDGTYNDVEHKDSSGNKVSGAEYGKDGNGGAIQNLNRVKDGTVKTIGILNVTNTSFLNNSATGKGGAIYNATDATTNIVATGTNTVNFEGNTATEGNDIYNAGILNLVTSADGKIVFNGGISGDSNAFGNMNIGTDSAQNLGSIVMNSTIAYQNVNLNSGTLQIGTNGSFNDANLNFNGGTLNTQNNQIDNLNVNDLNINSTSNFLFDVDLSANNSSDKITFNSINQATDATLNVGQIYITNTNLSGDSYSSKFLDGTNADKVNSSYSGPTITTVGDTVYAITVKNNIIKIDKQGSSGGFVVDVVDENINGHQVVTADENVGYWTGKGNALQGGSFSIYGNGSDVVHSEHNILGIAVGYDSQQHPQELRIEDVGSYSGFNSVVINNGGSIVASGTTFENNNASTADGNSGNGGVIQNNSGTATVTVSTNNGTSFKNNTATGLGGAIYNNGILKLDTVIGGEISFSGNKANGVANDIYTEDTLSILGSGTVQLDGGIAGKGSITSSTNKLILNGDNSNYIGSFTQTEGTTTVGKVAKFFEGSSKISGGQLNWNTNNDLQNGSLIVDSAKLVIGNDAQLSIKGNSNISKATKVTINDNANLNLVGKTMTIGNISGNGTLTADGSILTYDKNSGVTKGFASKNSSNVTVNGTDNSNVDSIIGAIVNGSNVGLTLNFEDLTTNKDISLNLISEDLGADIAKLNTSGNVAISGKLTNNAGTVTNSGTLTLYGTTENDSELINDTNSTLNINGTLTGNQTATITNNGIINVKDNASGFGGKLDSYGDVIVDNSSYLFGGEKNIHTGTLTINAGSIGYSDVVLGSDTQGAKLIHTISDNSTVNKIYDRVFKFADGTSNSEAIFKSADSMTANIDLSKVDNRQGNTISIDGANVTLVDRDYIGGTIYNFDNSNIKLGSDNTTVGDYKFSKVTGNDNKLSFNVIIADVAGATDGSKYLQTDKITIGNGGQSFKFGDIYISGKESGWDGVYSTKDGDILTGATFSDNPNFPDGKVDKLATGATTSWIYDISKTENSQSIQIKINSAADENTLYKMNHKAEGTRFFQFSDDDTNREQTYNIGQSLDETLSGDFTVKGYDKDKCTISGALVDSTGHETGVRGSFFDIKKDDVVTLSIHDVTLANASKATSGSVVNNESTVSNVTIDNVKIISSSSCADGGAIYNKGILNISNTKFTGNSSATQKGGAIYNDGTMNLAGITLDAPTETATNDIYQGANGKTYFVGGENTINSLISGKGFIENTNSKLVLNADNSGYTGTYTQESGQTDVNASSTFFGGETTIADGVLNWNTLKNYNSTLKVEKGSLNIGNVSKASLSLNSNSYIKKDTLVNINSKGEIKLNGGSITLDENDIWAGNISIGDENTVGSGTLTIDGLTSNGGIFANGGTIDIISGRLTASAGDVIKKATTVKIKDNALLAVRGGDVTLGATTDWASKGGVLLNNGVLTIKDLSNANGIFQANSGKLMLENSTFTVGKDSFINSSVGTNIDSNSKLQITDNGWVTIGDNDIWNGEVSLAGGTLNYERTVSTSSTMTGDLIATSGNLNLLKNSYINIKSPSNIAQAVSVDIQKGATVEISNGAEFNLDSNDKWNGLIKNELDGILKTDNVNNSAFGGMLQQNKGVSIFDNKSNITIDGKDSYILGGTVEIKNGSALNIGSGVADNHFFVSDLNMTNNSALNAMNSVLNKYQISNDMIVEGKNNLSIDIDGRNKVGDAFIVNNLTSNTNGTLNVADFNFIGLAPIDRQFKIRVFDAYSINDKVNFTSTDKEIFTPIGYYNLQSAGGGWYTSNMTRYNPQVFRGQVATLASFNNQLMIDDMLLNHVTLDSERLLAQSKNANIYASTLPQFAPYQYKKEDGGLWYKSYVNFENLSLTQGLKVGNNSYGSLVGADFPVIKLKHGWRLMPTAYIGYNGAHQTFNGVGMYQNGGQGGLMGTFMKDNFIGSVVAYGGGYNNEMSVAGNTDRAGNWFAGTAAKLAYNFHPTKHFTIQPTAFMSYNIFGRQNWGTDFGSMSMNSGLLNGINVAPGMNFIYAKETWSVYATFQYMYNINEQVGGRAGNVDLASVKMEHGYIQYGLGVTKTWKDRLNSFFQIVFRNGGRTGVGFQLGLNYTFDWFSPKSNKTLKANASQIKKTTTSNKKTQEVKEFQHIGSKTVLKSLSMK